VSAPPARLIAKAKRKSGGAKKAATPPREPPRRAPGALPRAQPLAPPPVWLTT
jgi:hypothetical protein